MLKIRRPLGRLIFNMGIAIPGKTVFLIETAPRKWKAVFLYFMGLYNFIGRHAYNSTYIDEYIEIYFRHGFEHVHRANPWAPITWASFNCPNTGDELEAIGN